MLIDSSPTPPLSKGGRVRACLFAGRKKGMVELSGAFAEPDSGDTPLDARSNKIMYSRLIAGHGRGDTPLAEPDSTVTVTVRGKNYNRVVEEQDGKYVFYVNESGYYTVLIQAESPDRSGEAEYEFYAR